MSEQLVQRIRKFHARKYLLAYQSPLNPEWVNVTSFDSPRYRREFLEGDNDYHERVHPVREWEQDFEWEAMIWVKEST